MSKEFYFSQYESPNIVIAPNMSSCKSPSPKRRKVRNSTVPIVKDSSETKELKHKQQRKKPSSSANADTYEDPSKDLDGNSTRKSKLSQNIGLDKKSITCKLKIPQKSSQTSISVEAAQNLATDVCLNSNYVLKPDTEKSNKKKIPDKIASDKNILDDKPFMKTNGPIGLRNNVLNDNLKEVKQSKNNSLKKSSSGFENNNNLKKPASKNKNDKLTLKNTKCDNHTQPIYNSARKIKSDKDECSKKVKQTSLVTLKHQKNEKLNKEKKTSSISVAIKRLHKQDKENPTAKNKTKLKHIQSSRSRPDSDVTSHYRDKHENQERTIPETTDINSAKKKIFNSNTSIKVETNIQSKTRKNHNKSEITITNQKLVKKKSESKSKKKSIKTDVKSTIPKTGNNIPVNVNFPIKIIFNLIRKDPHSALHSENSIESNSNKPNVDIDFLDDINVDEIVESLYTCGKKAEGKQVSSDRELNKSHTTITLEENSNMSQSDVADLIKILKGEEDDDLTRMSVENAETLQYNNDSTVFTQSCQHSDMFDYVSKSLETIHSNSNVKSHTVIKEINLDMLNTSKILGSTSARNIHDKIITKDCPIQSDSILNNKKNEDSMEIQHTNPEDDNINFVDPSCEEVKVNEVIKDTVQNTEKTKEKQKNNSLNSTSLPKMDIVKFDTYKTDSSLLKIDIIDNVEESENNNCEKFIHETGVNNIPLINISTSTAVNGDNRAKLNEPEHYSANVNEAETSSKYYQQNSPKHHEDSNSDNDTSFAKANIGDLKTNNSTSYPPHEITTVNLKDNSKTKKELFIANNLELEETKSSNKHFQNNLIGDVQEQILQEIKTESVKECQKSKVLNENKIVSITKSKYMEIETMEERLLKCTGLKYSVSTVIHNGKYSKIFQCKNQVGKYYALKMLTNTQYYLGKKKSEMLNTLIQGISKDNLFLVYVANTFNVLDKWCFLMEWYPKNLCQALAENENPFFIKHIQNFARQLTMAAMVLKKNNMVHLDINPRHILINYSNTCLKLCGFDNLRYINNMSVLPTTGCVNYRAPEIILGFRAGFEIDVWSTGLVLFEMATKKKLFPGILNNNILYKQICTLGCIPYEMITKSLFSGDHFIGSDFMRMFGSKGKNVSIIKNFYKNNILNDSIYTAYYRYWAKNRSLPQINYDIGRLNEFVQLLQQMLTVHPEFRLPIEYVQTNPFISNTYTYQEWNDGKPS